MTGFFIEWWQGGVCTLLLIAARNFGCLCDSCLLAHSTKTMTPRKHWRIR
jgi:hypothetical protein